MRITVPEVDSLADRIRRSARARHIEPARQAGRKNVTLRAGDIGPRDGSQEPYARRLQRLGIEAVSSRSRVASRGTRRTTSEHDDRVSLRDPCSTRRRVDVAIGWCSAQRSPVRPNTFPLHLGLRRPSRNSEAHRTLGDGHRLFLVSCVKTKRQTHAAREGTSTSPLGSARRGLAWNAPVAHGGYCRPSTACFIRTKRFGPTR